MQIRPSSALRNDYNAISELAKKTGEPVCSQSELDARMEELFNAAEG